MRTFFITGLPRSRTAWLANLLTYGTCFCFHEACRLVEKVDELPGLFASVDRPNVGTACCGFPLYYDHALALLPESHVVVVNRPAKHCQASYVKMLQEKLEATPVQVQETFDALVRNFASMQNALADRHTLEVQFADLPKRKTVQAIWDLCTGGAPFSYARWEMLETLQVNVLPKQVVSALKLEKLREIFKAAAKLAPVESSVATPAMTEFNQIILNFCNGTPGAFAWLAQLWEVLLTWDHIEDRDVIDRAMANRAFECLLFAWPENPFWQAHWKQLLPVLANAMNAWHHANQHGGGVKSYDAYTEVPCAVAFLIGGTPLTTRVMPRLRQLSEIIRTENEGGAQCP